MGPKTYGQAAWNFAAALISFALFFGYVATAAAGEDRVFRIYLDADRTGTYQSARAIEMGVRAALSDESLHPEGVRFELVAKDHRANAKRSHKNIQQFLADEAGLAVIGGQHSPPYLNYKDWINEHRALTLLPWSAAGPITRTAAPENWLFRVSVDDTKAGGFLVDQSMRVAGCEKPAVALWNSGWGKANHKTILAALETMGVGNPLVEWFDGQATRTDLRIFAREAEAAAVDCILFVGTWRVGANLVEEVATLSKPIRIFSHWGIMGGGFIKETSHEARSRVNLQLLQTCLPFGRDGHAPLQRAEAVARQMFPGEFEELEELPSAVGFVHAYDLSLILLSALRQTDFSGDIVDVRARVRDRLETLEEPVQGLLKTYVQPFSQDGFDAHEALGGADLCLAKYDSEGRTVFLTRPGEEAVSQ